MMHTGQQSPDGRLLLVEYRLCVLCTRMICLNKEEYKKVMLPYGEFVFAHEVCEPLKFFSEE